MKRPIGTIVDRHILAAATALLAASLAACGTLEGRRADSPGDPRGVLAEAAPGAPIPAGSGVVLLRARIKTHFAGQRPLESAVSPHGAPAYPFEVSVGTLTTRWQADGVPDAGAGTAARDPEAGAGMRYTLEKRLLLPPGEHEVELRLPAEGYAVKASVTVRAGTETVLEALPVYRYAKRPGRGPSFTKGLARVELRLDGLPLPPAR